MNLPDIPADATADAARAILERAGWKEIGIGDWSWVVADPQDRLAARVTPFDPGYRMFADACCNGPANRYLPRIDRILPLRNRGYVVVMERLWPAPEDETAAFCARIGIANDRAPEAVETTEDPDMIALRRRIGVLLAEGATRYRLWGGSDIRAGNVMADGTGALKVIDPIYVAGRKIVEAWQNACWEDLAAFSRAELEDFLTIPVWHGKDTDRAAMLNLLDRRS
jgi:hypothetical protein